MSEESHEERDKNVKIEVDSHPKHLAPRAYLVTDLKELIGVPATKDLDQVINGTLTTLLDSDSVTIIGGEVFFSHVRRGGSS
jgi:hypothetical protein